MIDKTLNAIPQMELDGEIIHACIYRGVFSVYEIMSARL